jgi:hypothetical protein
MILITQQFYFCQENNFWSSLRITTVSTYILIYLVGLVVQWREHVTAYCVFSSEETTSTYHGISVTYEQ